ncbi:MULTISPECIES: excinuclease ABC subunit UvrC [Selenomonas]|uniref:UvrABC system protein C n=1 Tax=Selenomonas ruminis TaxID=2593411 RepID=A0A5D6W737_9FIRM|nr:MULTISPECIES: excinuclease ABC subunit UvrC [unclassified Selenomonas]MBQ1867597.1 excinuclease ABC subunit UvrC [Selenomonas sp.]TYZ22534.1 excinuclease ABC subunit UvrC [Selenomonas sp. mPRGC5]
MTDIVEEKLKLLPDRPGVYIMKDSQGKIIYVGKAVVLKNRVRQYFQSNKNHTPKVRAMVSHIADFEIIMTHTEVEALILECNLIKKHRPRYNISLKDDKTYPYVKVTVQEEFPRVFITRRVLKDGARYFGPYTNATAVHESLKLLRRLFPLRTCKHLQERPCLEYHIKRCLAPCAGKVEKDEYDAMIRAVLLFLEGRTEEVEKELQYRMEAAAEAYHFEIAARLRDQLLAVRKIAEKQNIVTGSGDQDAVGMARSEIGVVVQIFFIRAGKMIGREHFLLRGSEEESDEAILTAFLQQYYHRAAFIPREVLLPRELPQEDRQLMEAWLSEKKKRAKVQLVCPQRGTKHDIVVMAAGNAAKYLQDEAARIKQANAQTRGAVEELGRYLGLKNPPERMECFDISHIQGSETVASMVVFEGGLPKKSDYRRFKIRSTEGKPDDFLSMREVTTRRYVGLPEAELPDLIVIDGGKGQLSSALEIIRQQAGHKKVPVVGLAKQFELVFREGESEPVVLPRHSQALYLIQRIRDEAHRFAITYHRKLRGKRNLVSVLDHIVGIGPKRRQALWSHFGTLAKIKSASVEELAEVDGMNMPAAEAVYNFFLAQEKFRGKEKES